MVDARRGHREDVLRAVGSAATLETLRLVVHKRDLQAGGVGSVDSHLTMSLPACDVKAPPRARGHLVAHEPHDAEGGEFKVAGNGLLRSNSPRSPRQSSGSAD